MSPLYSLTQESPAEQGSLTISEQAEAQANEHVYVTAAGGLILQRPLRAVLSDCRFCLTLTAREQPLRWSLRCKSCKAAGGPAKSYCCPRALLQDDGRQLTLGRSSPSVSWRLFNAGKVPCGMHQNKHLMCFVSSAGEGGLHCWGAMLR